jgi:hypothetical protein
MTRPRNPERRQAPTTPEEPSAEDRISLAGHDPEEVLKALLKVDPDSEPVENESPRKKPKGKTER